MINNENSRAVNSSTLGCPLSSLVSEAITDKSSGSLGNSEGLWWEGVNSVWQSRLAPEVDSLRKRARRQRKLKKLALAVRSYSGAARHGRSAQWAEWRARSVSLDRAAVLSVCNTRSRQVSCGCGSVVVPVGCRQTLLCASCARDAWAKWRQRIESSLRAKVSQAQAKWAASSPRRRARFKPDTYLITLTAPHSGDLAVDRATLARGWRDLSKRSQLAGGWWSSYVSVYEATSGSDGSGHVHMHVVAVSSWVPYEELHRVWSRSVLASCSHRRECYCTPSPNAHVEISPPYRPGDPRSRAHYGPESAASYVAKYLSKGVQPREMSAQKTGELLVGARGRRVVTASRGFWRARAQLPCRDCGELHRLDAMPISLLAAAPAACWRAFRRGVVTMPRVQMDL